MLEKKLRYTTTDALEHVIELKRLLVRLFPVHDGTTSATYVPAQLLHLVILDFYSTITDPTCPKWPDIVRKACAAEMSRCYGGSSTPSILDLAQLLPSSFRSALRCKAVMLPAQKGRTCELALASAAALVVFAETHEEQHGICTEAIVQVFRILCEFNTLTRKQFER